MAILVWVMVSLALWHFTVLVPDRFWGGIAGALVAALVGGGASGFLLPSLGLPMENPPGLGEALWAIPGATLALVASYAYGARGATGVSTGRASSASSPRTDSGEG